MDCVPNNFFFFVHKLVICEMARTDATIFIQVLHGLIHQVRPFTIDDPSLAPKYSGQDPQRLTCKKVPSPSTIREMSTLELFKWLLMHQKCPQVCISYGKYGPPSPSSKRELKFMTTPAGRTESHIVLHVSQL